VTALSEQRVREIYEHFAHARLNDLEHAIDEHIDFLSHAPVDIFPFLGRRRGQADVLRAFAEVHEKLEILSFWPMTTVVNGDRAALSVIIKVKDRATGRSAHYLAAHFLRFRNNRIIDFCAIIDSLDAARQLAGQVHDDQSP
jgi:ketosteroid isomerase-like protein